MERPRLYALVSVSSRDKGDSSRIAPDNSERLVAVKGDTETLRARLLAISQTRSLLSWREARTLKAQWDAAIEARAVIR